MSLIAKYLEEIKIVLNKPPRTEKHTLCLVCAFHKGFRDS
jgi:hypothetical protein